MTLEDAIVFQALQYVGVSAEPGPGREKFEGLMGYDENAEMRRSMSSYKKVSTCGLFIRGLIWWVFHQFLKTVDLHEINPPYAGVGNRNLGKVFDNLRDLGRRCHALETYVHGMLPEPGDIVFVGLDTKSSGHVFLVTQVTVLADGTIEIEGVEAGQVTVKGGYQCVRKKRHTWTKNGSKMNDHAVQIVAPGEEIDTFSGSDKNVSEILRIKKMEAALLAA